MTKLSLLVTSIFILLAASMWYLANASFKEHIHNKIQILGQEATHLSVGVKNVQQINHHLTISDVSFYRHSQTDHSAVLTLTGIDVVIEQTPKETKRKKNLIIIEKMSIEHINERFSTVAEKEEVINTIKHILSIVNETPVNKKAPLLVIKQLLINQRNGVTSKIKTETLLNTEKNEQQLFNELLLLMLTPENS